MSVSKCRLVLAAISVMSFASLMSIPEAWRREPVLELFVLAVVALVTLETFMKGKKKK